MAEKEPERPARTRSATEASPTAPRATVPPVDTDGGTAVATVSEPPSGPVPPVTLTEFTDAEQSEEMAADPPVERSRERSGERSGDLSGEHTGPPVAAVATGLLVGTGLICSAFSATALLTQPLAGLGLAVGLFGAGGGEPSRRAWPLVGAIVSVIALAVAAYAPEWLGPTYEASRLRPTAPPDAVRIIPLQLRARDEPLETDGYADASRAASQQGFIRVRVLSAAVGPVELSDTKRSLTKERFLAVAVQIQHLGGEPIQLVHWGEVAPRTIPAATATAAGRHLAMAPVVMPRGALESVELYPGQTASDVLVFEPSPAGAAVRLDLPAEAWGGRGLVRFHIPSSMIGSQPGKSTR